MADQSGMLRVGSAFIQQGFQPPCGSIEKEGFDAVGHVSFYHRGHRGTRRSFEPPYGYMNGDARRIQCEQNLFNLLFLRAPLCPLW